MTRWRYLLFALILFVGLIPTVQAGQQSVVCNIAIGPCVTSPAQGILLQNSQTTGAANTAVTVTLTAVPGMRARVWTIDALCSAGSAQITVTDGGTTIWQTTATEVTTTRFVKSWNAAPLTAATNQALVITLGTCGVGNSGTLAVQADKN